MPVLAPVATREIGVPAPAIGYFIAVAYVGSMLGSAAAGGWAARFGPIRVSQAGLALCLAGLALAASGWAPLMLLGASCVVLAAALAPVRPRSDVGLNPEAPVSVRAAFLPVKLVASHPHLRGMAVTSFVYGGVQITLVTYLVTFLVDSFALSLVLAGAVMAASQVASVVGRIVWGALADRVVTRRTMLGLLGLGMGVSAMATLAAAPEWPAWVLFAFASVFGATAVGWNGVYLAEVARVAPPGQVSQATGGCLFFTFLGVVLTPLIFNLVLALGGGYGVAYAVLGVPGLAVGARLLLRRPA